MRQSKGSQRLGHDRATEQNNTGRVAGPGCPGSVRNLGLRKAPSQASGHARSEEEHHPGPHGGRAGAGGGPGPWSAPRAALSGHGPGLRKRRATWPACELGLGWGGPLQAAPGGPGALAQYMGSAVQVPAWLPRVPWPCPGPLRPPTCPGWSGHRRGRPTAIVQGPGRGWAGLSAAWTHNPLTLGDPREPQMLRAPRAAPGTQRKRSMTQDCTSSCLTPAGTPPAPGERPQSSC